MRGRMKNLFQRKTINQFSMPLGCSICLFTGDDKPIEDAITIINSCAVCFNHAGLLRNNVFMTAVRMAEGASNE